MILDQYGRPYAQPRRDGDPTRPFDNMALPTVLTFNAIVGSGLRAFWHGRHDAARRNSREDSLAMRHEPWLMALLQERKLAVASLKWHVEVDDDRDPAQRRLKNGMTKIIQSVPRWKRLLMCVLEKIWYGRYGIQWLWKWGQLGDRRALGVRAYYPINGDKIGHTYDHHPYILVIPAYTEQIQGRPEIIRTTEGGYGLVVKGSWAERIMVCTHMVEDADYFEPEQADAMHGMGIRDVLYWSRYMRHEFLANVVDWAERVGLGTTIIYYDQSNPKSKTEAEAAAHNLSRRAVITWPRMPGDPRSGGGIERVEVPSNGAQLLLTMQAHFEDQEERYVVGQSLSSGTEGSGLGGSGVADLHADTKYRITAFDAANTAEDLTGDEDHPGLVTTIKRWTFPEMRDVPCKLVFDVDPPDSERVLGAVVQCINVGVDFRKDDVRALTGLSAPGPDDEIISAMTIQRDQLRAQLEAQMQQGGQPAEDPHAELLGQMGQDDPTFAAVESGDEPPADAQPSAPERSSARGQPVRYAPGRQGAGNFENPGEFSPGGHGVLQPSVESPVIPGPAKRPQPQQLTGAKAPTLSPSTLRDALRSEDRERIVRHLVRPDVAWDRLRPEDRQEVHQRLGKLSTREAWMLLQHLSGQAPYDHYGPLAHARDLLVEHLQQRPRGKEVALHDRNRELARHVDTEALAGEDLVRARGAMHSLPRVQGVEGGFYLPAGIDPKAALQHPGIRTSELSPEQQQLAEHRAIIPAHINPYLTDDEALRITSRNAQALTELFGQLPHDSHFEEMARLGHRNRGWYEQSERTIKSAFGRDAVRFAALLAATSPRQPVRQNLTKALAIWSAWNALGRPTDVLPFAGPDQEVDPTDTHRMTMAFLRTLPQGEFGGHRNNIVRALTQPEHEIRLSGNKVQSFFDNLAGNPWASTNDVWMANFGGIDQKRFGSSSGYLAFTAKVRRVAERLGWKPAEVQETIWSAFRTLAALQAGGLSASQSVAAMVGEDPHRAEDFASLMTEDPDVRRALDAAGVGQRLAEGLRGGAGGNQAVPRPSGQSPTAAQVKSRAENAAARVLGYLARRAGEYQSSTDPIGHGRLIAGTWSGTHIEPESQDPAETPPERPVRHAMELEGAPQHAPAPRPRIPTAEAHVVTPTPGARQPKAIPEPPSKLTSRFSPAEAHSARAHLGVVAQVAAAHGQRMLDNRPAWAVAQATDAEENPWAHQHADRPGAAPLLAAPARLQQALAHPPHHDWLVARSLAGDHPSPQQLARSLQALEQHRAETQEYPHLHGALHPDLTHAQLPGVMDRHQTARDRMKSFTFQPQYSEDVETMPQAGEELLAPALDRQQHPYAPRLGELVYLRNPGGDIVGTASVHRMEGQQPVLQVQRQHVENDRNQGRQPQDRLHSDAARDVYGRGYLNWEMLPHHDNDLGNRLYRLGQADRDNYRTFGHSAPGMAEDAALGRQPQSLESRWLHSPGGRAASAFARRWLVRNGLAGMEDGPPLERILHRLHNVWAATQRAADEQGQTVHRNRLFHVADRVLQDLFPAREHPLDRDPHNEQAQELFGHENREFMEGFPNLVPELRNHARQLARNPDALPPAIRALAEAYHRDPTTRGEWAPPAQRALEEAVVDIQHPGENDSPETAAARDWLNRQLPAPFEQQQDPQLVDLNEHNEVQQRFLRHMARELAGWQQARFRWEKRPDLPEPPQPWPTVPPRTERMAEEARRSGIQDVRDLPPGMQDLARVAMHEPARLPGAVEEMLASGEQRERTPLMERRFGPGAWSAAQAERWLREHHPELLAHADAPDVETGRRLRELQAWERTPAVPAQVQDHAQRLADMEAQQERGGPDPDAARRLREMEEREDNPNVGQERDVVGRAVTGMLQEHDNRRLPPPEEIAARREAHNEWAHRHHIGQALQTLASEVARRRTEDREWERGRQWRQQSGEEHSPRPQYPAPREPDPGAEQRRIAQERYNSRLGSPLIRVIGGSGKINYPGTIPPSAEGRVLPSLFPEHITGAAMSAALQAQLGYQQSQNERESGVPSSAVWGASTGYDPRNPLARRVGMLADAQGNVWSREHFGADTHPMEIGHEVWPEDAGRRHEHFPRFAAEGIEPHYRIQADPRLQAILDHMIHGGPKYPAPGGHEHYEQQRERLADMLEAMGHPSAARVRRVRFPDEIIAAIAHHEAIAHHQNQKR